MTIEQITENYIEFVVDYVYPVSAKRYFYNGQPFIYKDLNLGEFAVNTYFNKHIEMFIPDGVWWDEQDKIILKYFDKRFK